MQYCDDAYLKVKKADLDGTPYELLITDLSFKRDWREQKIGSGEELIGIIKKESPDIKIIAYSIEDRIQKVRSLITNYGTNGYVCKTRRGLAELTNAISSVFENKMYLSPEVSQALNSTNDLEINDYDILLLEHLSKGFSQDDISCIFLKTTSSLAV